MCTGTEKHYEIQNINGGVLKIQYNIENTETISQLYAYQCTCDNYFQSTISIEMQSLFLELIESIHCGMFLPSEGLSTKSSKLVKFLRSQ